LFIIHFNAVCLPFFCGKNHKNTKLLVSNPDETTLGISAFAPGNTQYGKLFSLHSCIRDFPGSESHGVHASDTTQISLSCINFT
jgi:hypothetical protein